jgi:23S rRNA (adenine2503-C2)-methyltransferase
VSRSPTRLYDLDFSGLDSLLKSWGEPSYRAAQVWEWLYVHLVDAFDDMTNLPKFLRERLAQETTIGVLEVIDSARSPDKRTRKDLLRLPDGETIEAVLMRYERRRTACISTQVGCALDCPFCATGQMGFRRDLSGGEIVAQALHFARQLRTEGGRLTNLVLMGMGEPLANYDASLEAIHRMTDPDGFRLGQRHITLSTVGLVPQIRRLADEGLQITLAVSLHAATDDLRDQLVPVNRRYGLDALADRLRRALPASLAHVNLIPLNPSAGYQGGGSSDDAVAAFAAILDRRGVPYTVRVRRGAAIEAGCGQLRQRILGP